MTKKKDITTREYAIIVFKSVLATLLLLGVFGFGLGLVVSETLLILGYISYLGIPLILYIIMIRYFEMRRELRK